MALIITPSEDPDITLDVKYATPGDILTVLQVNPLIVGFPSAQPNPAIYSCRPLVNTRGVTDLSSAWANCTAITEFPLLDFRSCVDFESAWEGCTSLTSFPANAFDNCQCSNYTNGFVGCALSRSSVDNILISLDASGVTGGRVDITGGTNDGPSAVGRVAKASLIAKGWVVNVERPCNQPPFNCSTDVDPYCVTDFTSAWENCDSITSFPLLDVSSGVNFTSTWARCYSLESFPLLDTSSGTNFNSTWLFCLSLTSFPQLNMDNATDLSGTFSHMRALTSFPAINFPAGQSFYGTWNECWYMASFPQIDVSNGIDFGVAWGSCYSLTSFPPLNVSKGTSFYGAWNTCSGLTSFPMLDVSKGTSFALAWAGCSSLTSFPSLDFSSADNLSGTWYNCSSLVSFPAITFKPNTNFHDYWTSYGTWRNCTSLVNFPPNLFDNCTETIFYRAWYNCALSQQSVDNILISIDTAGQLNGTLGIDGGTSSAPGPAGLAAKASLISKGWTVTTNAPTIVTQNLVLHLDAGNPASYPGTGTTWDDLSGNGYVGTLTGGVTYDSSNGGSLVFNGTTGYVLTNYTQTNVTKYTISMWIKGAVSGRGLISNRGVTVSSGKGFCILLAYGPFLTNLYYGINSDLSLVGAQSNNSSTLSLLNDGNWHNVVGVFNGQSGVQMTGSECSIYIDSQLLSTSPYLAFSSQTPPVSGAQGTIIGAGFHGPSGFHQGHISHVLIYTKNLSQQEVTQNFNLIKGRYGL